jgi:energy-coupling factor transport system permease protein
VSSAPSRPRAEALHPVTLLVLLGCAALLVFGIPSPLAAAAVLVAAWVAAAVLGCASAALRLAVPLLLPVLVVVLLVQGLTYPGGTTVLVEAGPLAITSEGLQVAAQLALRMAATVSAVLVLVVTVPPHRLLTGLTAVGAPPRLALVAALALDAVPQLRRRAGVTAAALRVRGVDPRTVRGGLATVHLLVASLLVGTVHGLGQRSDALAGRGLDVAGAGPAVTWHAVPDGRGQRWVRRLAPVATVLLVFAVAVGRGLGTAA